MLDNVEMGRQHSCSESLLYMSKSQGKKNLGWALSPRNQDEVKANVNMMKGSKWYIPVEKHKNNHWEFREKEYF